MPSNRAQARREERGLQQPLTSPGLPLHLRQDAGIRPLRGPSGAPRRPQPRAPSRAPTAHAPRPEARPAPPIASAPSIAPSLLPSLWRLGKIRDSAPGERPGGRHSAQARRRRAGEGSAKEEREAGEAKVAVRAGPRPESPPGGGGRGAA